MGFFLLGLVQLMEGLLTIAVVVDVAGAVQRNSALRDRVALMRLGLARGRW